MDLTIQFTCPNGMQVVTHSEQGSCTNFGNPVLTPNGLPGTGFTYSWSPDSPDGNPFENPPFPNSLPPGNYQSFESLESLAGCPMNGIWSIEICDSLGGDDGFLFMWGVAEGVADFISEDLCDVQVLGTWPSSACNEDGSILINAADNLPYSEGTLAGQLWFDGSLVSEQSGDSLIEWTGLSQGEYQVALQLIAAEVLDLGTQTVVLEPIFTPEVSNSDVLCAVAFDGSTGRNKVVWTKDDNVMIATYEVQRESNITSEFETIGTVHSDSLSEFIDSEFDPSYSSARYNLVSVDSCGNAIDNSINYHRTIHLQANSGVNGEVNLYWNPYEGISYPNFEIHRSQDGENYFLIGSVSNSTYAFTDPSPPSGDKWYQIRISLETPCEPIRTTEFIGSNISDLSALAVQAAAIETLGVSIVQSQESPLLTWRHARGGIEARVFDSSGRELMAETSSGASGTIALNRLTASGENAAFYLVRVTERSGGSTKVLRFVYVP
jgi:hypothetical protein